ncbi:MAG TPA: hypothetical protein VEZ47_10990 [Gemmatirosa sp.]|nr:hypothetical protein [Gemmatirosa sp.]
MSGRCHQRSPRALVALAAVLALCGGACDDRDAVRVRLAASAPPFGDDPRVLLLRANVTGPVGGLRYRWFSVVGTTNPQESDEPTTAFRFAEGPGRDRVSVEVWRDGRQIARDEIDVALDRDRLPARAPMSNARVAITRIPPYDSVGGPHTRAWIAGRVVGAPDPTFRVVLYARAAEVWYIQPTPAAQHPIGADGRWESWTHTGSTYAALLVRSGFVPLPLYDVLPPLGDRVVARAIVEGARQ